MILRRTLSSLTQSPKASTRSASHGALPLRAGIEELSPHLERTGHWISSMR
jgi:hypothetical protein